MGESIYLHACHAWELGAWGEQARHAHATGGKMAAKFSIFSPAPPKWWFADSDLAKLYLWSLVTNEAI